MSTNVRKCPQTCKSLRMCERLHICTRPTLHTSEALRMSAHLHTFSPAQPAEGARVWLAPARQVPASRRSPRPRNSAPRNAATISPQHNPGTPRAPAYLTRVYISKNASSKKNTLCSKKTLKNFSYINTVCIFVVH